jgi:chromosomal replication initiator protein
MVLTPTQRALARKIREIIWETALKHNVSTDYLIGHNRRKGVVWARFEIMWRARHELNAPYALIGQVLGGRDHSTIMHGIERYENR